MVQTKRADFKGLAQKLGVSPVSVRIMRNRGLETEEAMRRYLYGTADDLYDGSRMTDMERASEILVEKLKSGKRIRVIGDYDIDGVCSSYLLLTGLRRVSEALSGTKGRIDYEIPDRIADGYGMNERMIRQASSDQVDTLVTCDNGIAAAKEIRLAGELGMTVIVTDHHEIPVDEEGNQALPPAAAVVDPKRKGDSYPYPEICGAVVVYKLLQLLYRRAEVPEAEWKELLQFAAVATVGDVMRLQDENRLIVKYGLRQLAETRNLGLRCLAEKNGLDMGRLSAYHIGFVIGPCLNAGGRLQTAKLALRLLQADTREEAERLAEELKELNDLRKDMTAKGEAEAIRQVEERYAKDKVLVVFLPECHESLAGIIAGRVREHFHKPAFVLTKSQESAADGMAKGSGRSIEAYHMFQGLCQVSDLLPKFGGHPMAAGLSVREADIGELRRRLNENAELTEEDFIPRIWIDVPMPFEYASEELVRELERLEPFGQGNEKPLFAQKDLWIKSARVLGKNRNVVRLSLAAENGFPIEGILLGDGDEFMSRQAESSRIDVTYYPDINEYNGNRTLQAVIKNYKLH
ncbi:MAG TPA: single-stranded-DNA-specific exonuclease RecJ [Candidatus Copromonas avistercoris]|nr:single-stranded-DNA-specific exonuclease RecJ [Candidatus Copromonas avistercoris]